jgi:hypothetical protein
MIKGWKNDPFWVMYYEQKKEREQFERNKRDIIEHLEALQVIKYEAETVQ